MAPPPQHVEEAWQSAEFFVNKVRMHTLFRPKGMCFVGLQVCKTAGL